jgi:monoamine oxidase
MGTAPSGAGLADDLDAVIVGAGFAGLSVAERLRAARRRFLVLEATDRPGGRARSGSRLGASRPVELGALMIHGRTVSTHAWARRYGLAVRPLPVLTRCRVAYRRHVGRYPWFALPFHPAVGTRAAIEGHWTVPRALQRYRGPERSLAALEDEWKVSPRARLLVELIHAHTYATDPENVGVLGSAEEDRAAAETYFDHNFQLVDGYSALAQRSAKSLRSAVRFGRAVTEIVREGDQVRVRVGGPDGNEEYLARTVVITVPLGVLKAGAIRFDPPLPEEKRRAIGRIGFGDGYALSIRVRGGTMRSRLGDFSLLWGGSASTFYRPLFRLRAPVEVVTAFTVGRGAAWRTNLGRGGLVAETVAEWDGIMPAGVTLGTVEESDVHLWNLDPWTRGAYSYLPPGTSLQERRVLAQPVEGRLFFAGEATHFTGESGTVSGAIASGERAAAEVLEALRATAP